MYAEFTAVGRLVADPEVRNVGKEDKVVNIRIAVNRFSKGESVTDFFNVVAWNNLADFIGNNFHKGNAIGIHGTPTIREFENKDGVNVRTFEVLATKAFFTGERREEPAPKKYSRK